MHGRLQFCLAWHRAHASDPEVIGGDIVERLEAKSARALLAQSVEPPSPAMSVILEAWGDAFASLDPYDQNVLRMKENAGLPYGEIVAILPPEADPKRRKELANSIKTRVHRAKARVRELMQQDARVPRTFFRAR